MSALPDRVDAIIIGTGLVNSILAAACSRIGKSVLHLDRNSYYGSDWASFTLLQLLDWIKSKHPDDESLQSIPEELTSKSRMFCLDLAPRFLYSNGEMVDLLVKSNVARYHEFKNNIRILCSIDDDIHVIPCRRNEVFTSPLLPNLADKRRLMKFIEMCLSEEVAGGEKPIGEFLKERGLSPTLTTIITSIASGSPVQPTREACEQIKRLIIATERYGRSPFLFPLYGCGEFPQSFCRLSAVFGGLYCLNTHIETLGVSDERFTVTLDHHAVQGDKLFVEPSAAIDLKLADNLTFEHNVSRAILITRKSIVTVSGAEDFISFMRMPPSDRNANLVFLIELNSSALVCPKDFNIIYIWMRSNSADPRKDLEPTVKRVLGGDTSCVAWSFYYQQPTSPPLLGGDRGSPESCTKGLYVTGLPCEDIDYASAVREAEHLFKRVYPDEEFLPRAPDPDEIVSV